MTNKKSVPTFEGRLYTGEELHGLSGNWVRRAEVDALLDEVEQLRADISQAYDLRDKAEGRYCTALGEIERLTKEIEGAHHDIDRLMAACTAEANEVERLRVHLRDIGSLATPEDSADDERQFARMREMVMAALSGSHEPKVGDSFPEKP